MMSATEYDSQLPPSCPIHKSELEWIDCWDCGGDGFTHHECGEDTCACLEPENNVICDTCGNECGWYKCHQCKKSYYRDELIEMQDKQEYVANDK